MPDAAVAQTPALEAFMGSYQQRINAILTQRLEGFRPHSVKLKDAMAYSLTSGGKRIRPLLVYSAAQAVTSSRSKPNDLTDAAAGAIECIHCYSLIHDDLPAMDDDDLRRGQPTNHVVFGEAMAILAGDALQTMAFEWLSESYQAKATEQLAMVNILASASGDKGMVAGQAIDLAAVDQQLDDSQLSTMHSLKTGALICASVQLGALSTGQASQTQTHQLVKFARAIGLAFQIQDDILDVTVDTSTLGKQQGADAAHNKPTFVSLLGLEEAQRKADELFRNAIAYLEDFDKRADNLRHLAAYIVQRPY